jgi:hypothetical protein
MTLITRSSVAALALVGSLGLGGCSTTTYAPQVVARGELTLRYDHGFELVAGGQRVSSGVAYNGLARYVRCVPKAHEHARSAQRNGGAAITLSVLGGVIGLGGLIGLVGIWDEPNRWSWVGGGVGLGALGATLAVLSWRYKNHANGHAVDAMNYYNDSVGSLGATCDDLRYPEPAGPAPEPTAPPASPAPSPSPTLPPTLPPPPTLGVQ